jgi:hypothetical protein
MKSRVTLFTSLALNVVLVAVFGWFSLPSNLQRPVRSESLPAPADRDFSQVVIWSQLESPDYPTYIANLRRIGCPEQTVREIVAADLDDLYRPRRQLLQAKLTASSVAADELNEAKAGLNRLQLEQGEILRILFGLPQAATADATALPQRGRPLPAHRVEVEDSNATMPLAFQLIDTNRVTLTSDDLLTLEQVRATFLQELGTNQDLNSSEYMQRWNKAQSQADNLLDAMLGRQAGLQYRQAAEQALSTSSRPAEAIPNLKPE